MRRTIAVLMWLAAAGCGGGGGGNDAGPPPDAPDGLDGGGADAGTTDAGGDTDAAVAADRRAIEITSASGRMTGPGYTLDFQLGHPVDQGRATGPGFSIEGGAAVKE